MPPAPSIRKIGLTGGIGSGKSTVGKILSNRKGFALIDADEISRALTAPNGEAIQDIKKQFGPEFIASDQSLNRQRMRELVFSEPEAKKRLEAIIHPRVLERIEQQLNQSSQAGFETALIDIPLLAESHSRWKTRLDAVLVVDCWPQTQIQRVVARSGLDQETVQRIIATQASREERNSLANWIIFNDGLSLDELESKVTALDFKF